jgi:acetyl-CoA carboxylase carboxyltransferase component
MQTMFHGHSQLSAIMGSCAFAGGLFTPYVELRVCVEGTGTVFWQVLFLVKSSIGEVDSQTLGGPKPHCSGRDG